MRLEEVPRLVQLMGVVVGIPTAIFLCLVLVPLDGEHDDDDERQQQDESRLLKFFHFYTIKDKHLPHNKNTIIRMAKEDDTSACSESDTTSNDGSVRISRVESDNSQSSEGQEAGMVTRTTNTCNESSSQSATKRPLSLYCCASVQALDMVVVEGVYDDDEDDVENQRNLARVLSNKGVPEKNDDDVEEEEDDECCSICLERYLEQDVICTPKTGGCNHVFHKGCLFEWVKNHSECPLCRTVLLVEEQLEEAKEEEEEEEERLPAADPSQ